MGLISTALFKKLQFDTLNASEQLKILKEWCYTHVSRDINFTGKFCCALYVQLVKKYLDVFIPLTSIGLHNSKPELDDLTIIQYAAFAGFDRFIESSKISNNQLNSSNASGMTPLHLAAQLGHVHSVEALLSKGADSTQTNKFLELAAHVALTQPSSAQLKANKEIIFKKLWAINPKIITHQDYEGNTVLHNMAAHGYDELLNDVLTVHSTGALHFNHHGLYPIHTAILNNQLKCAEYLLSNPGVATLKDAEYRAPIHYAGLHGNTAMIELCLKHTPNDVVNSRDTDGKTAYMLATEVENHEAEEVFTAHGIHLNEQSRIRLI